MQQSTYDIKLNKVNNTNQGYSVTTAVILLTDGFLYSHMDVTMLLAHFYQICTVLPMPHPEKPVTPVFYLFSKISVNCYMYCDVLV